jgi:hypothetical protein
MITVGGIATKPRYLNGQLEPRELLELTISFDHDIVTAPRLLASLADPRSWLRLRRDLTPSAGRGHESDALGAR